MRRFLALAAFILAAPLTTTPAHAKTTLTNDQIKALLIRKSISSYPGTCPCPYSVNRAGHRCGKRSAYSKPGGRTPLCYPSDVTRKMINNYRKQHSG